jgi:hypothetical protein
VGRRCAKRSSPLPEDPWEPATGAEGKPRDGAWVTELIDQVNLSGWP